MDIGADLFKATNSLRQGSANANLVDAVPRANSNSFWRDGNAQVFAQSAREEDDEESLKWASLEKLPTYDRIRKGLLSGSKGATEVDVGDFGNQERKILFDRLLKTAEEDNEKLLRKLRDRIDSVGVTLPTIEVRYDHMHIEAEAHVGSRALPSFLNFYITLLEGLFDVLHVLPNKKKRITIINDISGVIKPCRMTLLLGPPSSGKTTFMLALAGKLDKELDFSGSVTYNGHTMKEFVPQRTAAYISQHDLHMGEMTVRETLTFSAKCQGVGSRYEMLAETLRREKEANIKPDPDVDILIKAAATPGQQADVVTDYVLKVLGLDICADTMVGNDMLRGVSGGQKKRVTTGEMLVGPSKVLFMDEISTGLDSSTTYQIVNSLRHSVHILQGTALISLLQPAPETYNLFDDIILLSDGYVVYQGPRENVLEFFEHMGFKCPQRKGVADFLQEVTSRKDQKQYYMHSDKPYTFVTAKEFAEAFKSFHVGQKIEAEIATPFDRSKGHPAALTVKKFGTGKNELVKALTQREMLLIKRNSFVYIFKMGQIGVMAVVAMTVFFRTEMGKDNSQDGSLYFGAIFFGVATFMFNGMAEFPLTIGKLSVFYKQRDLLFYPPWAYALPMWYTRIPFSIIEAAIWAGITYYAIGLDKNIGRFIRYYFALVLTNQMGFGLFRLIAAICRDMIIANVFGGFTLFILMALGGFVLSRDKIADWWIWGYYISPLMYAMNAIGVNEFLAHSWNKPNPVGPGKLGASVLKSRGFYPYWYWYWIGVGVLLGLVFVFNGFFTMALVFLNPLKSAPAVVADDDVSEQKEESKDGTGKESKGMVLPFEPHSITFDNIRYSVDMPQRYGFMKEMKDQGAGEDRLLLLKGVSGAFRPGVLTALMGVSGAGKTTLMDVLAGRKTGGYIEGEIKISGYPKKQETFARISGYCEQTDIHSPHVTVYEALIYSAWLRLPPEVDAEKRKMFVNEVINLVELNTLVDALVGLPGVSGLSTEQRKRLTIAVELVANPSIIFMDEPTSGLDARAAAIVMRTVRNTVDTGRTVVCTIHQPSIDIFEAFDELFLMKRGGLELYAGAVGKESCELIKYFESIEGISKIPEGYNPATWMLEVSTAAQEVALGIDFTEVYQKSDLCRRNKDLIKELGTPRPGTTDLHFATKYSQSFITQVQACLWKQRCSYWRNTSYTAVKMAFTTVIALMIGTMFYDLGSKIGTVQDLFNAMGAMYSACLFLGVQNGSSVQPVVAVERTVFYRERAAGMYSALPYAIAQVLVEIPYIFCQAVIFSCIVYSMIQFKWTLVKFAWFFYFSVVTFMYFTFYGMMTVAMTPNSAVAAICASAFYGMWNLFCGFLIPRPSIPVWWRWYYWACPVSYTLYGLLASQFGDYDNKILVDVKVSIKVFLEEYFGFEHSKIWCAAVAVAGFAILFALVFGIAIKILNFQRR